ncbi:hypothetical protein ACFVIZ_13195 [Streptomyces anulatus]|uniref:hypothetical protein n=1 Tax=Streptomyces anulatus TaxID=1892 RepID=UPI00364125B2
MLRVAAGDGRLTATESDERLDRALPREPSASRVKIHHAPERGTPISLRVELVGEKKHGRVVVRSARRTLGQPLRKPDRFAQSG